MWEIDEVQKEGQIEESVRVIRKSFRKVAFDFDLTRENCPSHPSFITFEDLLELKRKGIGLYGLYSEGEQAGFIAIEGGLGGVYYVEKLAVLPEHQHKGFGRALMDFAAEHVRSLGGEKVSVAIIDESRVLKDWYISLGFQEMEVRRFEQLPFTVCFLEKEVS